MLRKFGRFMTVVLTAAAAALAATSCATADGAKGNAEQPSKRFKTALYLDDGSAGNGVFHWIHLIANSPQLEFYGVTGQDVRDGKLEGMDILVMPGGYSGRQYKSLREEGAEKVREFIRGGGHYVGTCAGFACTLNDKGRLKLLPFSRKPNSGGATAKITVDFSKEGAKVLDIAPGRYVVRYSGGPIPIPGKVVEGGGEAKVLAVYKNTVSYVNKPEGNFFNAGAALYGTLGKGKVVATSFHPEYWESTFPIVAGCFYAVTGVKTTFEFPEKKLHPLRVGFWSSGFPDVDRTNAFIALDRCADIDLRIVTSHEFNLGELRHLDALVVANDPTKGCKKLLQGKYNCEQLEAFLKRGGRIFASGVGVESVPKHPNVTEVPVGGDFVDAVLKNCR